MPNTLDVLKINNAEEIIGLIDEVAAEIPEINFFSASPVEKYSYKTLAVNALPDAGFRAAGQQRIYSAAVLANYTVNCYNLDASWILDCAQGRMSDWGAEFAVSLMTQTSLKAALMRLAKQTWYGQYAADAGFNGLSSFIGGVVDDNNNPVMTVDANPGTSVTDGSKVFAVRTGMDSIQYAWGRDGELVVDDVGVQQVGDATSGASYYHQQIAGYVGLQITNKYAAGMITNLSAGAGANGLNDNLIYQLLEKFPAGQTPQAFFMSRRSLMQLRQSRTATNATGAPAPIPREVEGIPIYVTDAIINTEGAASSSSSSSGSV